jgi:hypothetical protein
MKTLIHFEFDSTQDALATVQFVDNLANPRAVDAAIQAPPETVAVVEVPKSVKADMPPVELPVTAEPAKVETQEITLGTVKAAFLDYFKANGTDAAKTLLQTFGAEKVSDIKPGQYTDFLAAIS